MEESVPKQQEHPDQQAQHAMKTVRIKQPVIQLFGFIHKGVVEKKKKTMGQTDALLSFSKQVFQVLQVAFLRESYLVSLVSLSMCGLTSVNLLNAGYSMSLSLCIFSS